MLGLFGGGGGGGKTASTTMTKNEEMMNMQLDGDGDNESCSDASSWTSTSQEMQSEQSFASNPSLTATETRIVRRSKHIVYLALFLAGLAVGVATYFLVSHQEENTFEIEFHGYARELGENAQTLLRTTIGQIESLSTSITSFASTIDTQWPNFTLPHFEERISQARALSGAELIAFVPIVPATDVVQWEAYAQEHQDWIQRGLTVRGLKHVDPGTIAPHIYSPVNNNNNVFVNNDGLASFPFHVPVWQIGPAPKSAHVVMQELLSYDWFQQAVDHIMEYHHTVITKVVNLEFLVHESRETDVNNTHPRTAIITRITKQILIAEEDEEEDNHDDEKREEQEEIVGFMVAVIPWEYYFEQVLPDEAQGILATINDNCGSTFSYLIQGEEATLHEGGTIRDPRFNDLTYRIPEFYKFDHKGQQDVAYCHYSLEVVPTNEFRDAYMTHTPLLYALAIVSVFLMTTGVFLSYDCAVQRRQERVISLAKRTNEIVTSLFPKNVQERILEQAREKAEAEEEQKLQQQGNNGNNSIRMSVKEQLKSVLETDNNNNNNNNNNAGNDKMKHNFTAGMGAPIADFFPDVTIMFADLVGFTAWSSMRQPAEVFTLLETVYCEFDVLCRKRRIFKVETVGDCYVAAAGLPDRRKDHAVAMARYARDCRHRTMSLMCELEVKLGPDTGELGIRIGIHSGPVTAGVLRGDKARFQLFGDTMNTASRIESTGKKNMIQLSEETAHLLKEAGKGHWIKLREDKISAKGKGELTTFWLDKTDNGTSVCGSLMLDAFSLAHATKSQKNFNNNNNNNNMENEPNNDVSLSETPFPITLSSKHIRLIDWNTEVLAKLLKDVVQRRDALGIVPDPLDKMQLLERMKPNGMALDEVVEIIHLPAFDPTAAKRQKQVPPVELDDEVQTQLHSYLHTIAALYRDNPFHNFEHVSHVLMSVNKLLSRIVAPDLSEMECPNERSLHDHTYGITSDPLTQFAVVFAALIHDADHQGVPNAQLVKEKTSIALAYRNKSVAEQNSVDIAWHLLMDESFADLRRTIYTTEAEFRRFRQLVVNAVMATDIMDKELGNARKVRWNTAFSETSSEEPAMTNINRKATIVIDHIIQASDVAHTMQHWHIYVKWNSRLFEEMTRAYRAGRLENDPAEKWYDGEIGFFDFYIIPLAKKLKDCGVFGVSSDEYLNYALKNRKEWEEKGRSIVSQFVNDFAHGESQSTLKN